MIVYQIIEYGIDEKIDWGYKLWKKLKINYSKC